MKRIIFQCPLALGDIVLLTAAVRDLHQAYPGRFLTDVRSHYPELWQGNPYLSPLTAGDDRVEVIDCDYPLIQLANRAPYHCLHGFIEFLNERLGLHIRPSLMKGDLYLSAEEKAAPSPLRQLLGVEVPFWILVAGGKYDYTIKWWSSRRFQEVVDALRGRVQFVQVGRERDYHPSLNGVIDLCGQTSVRSLVQLVYHAQGVLCPVTGMMHLAAAVEPEPGANGPRPCVVIGGGREPVHWEAYPHHQFIHTIGALDCCRDGGCWRSRTRALGDGDSRDAPENLCRDVAGDLPRCMDLIDSAEVVRRIELYFRGEAVAPLTVAEARICRKGVRQLPSRGALGVDTAADAAKAFVHSLPLPERPARGRGIVLCAGGPNYLPSAWVCLRVLRRLGCRLPVEIWHLGEGEIDQVVRSLFERYGVRFRDACRETPLLPMRRLGGWELKSFAVMHSSFRELLLLDADNVPAADPTFLFRSRQYQAAGAVFWPDRVRIGPERSIWHICGVPYQDEPEFESGQMIVDKSRCRDALSLALWYNSHSDLFFRHLHGDKDTFHMAFRRLKRPYAMPTTPVRELDGVLFQHDFQGRVLFQHCSGRKWSLNRPMPPHRELRFQSECAAYLAELAQAWKPEDQQPRNVDNS
ncbi:MAG TPA: glycosyltransferase family 9 protein [Candidatus Saccharimonadales bacterium]|nr:glycosyltransferase family 9 protein [Candidatus Saccharimonadales bacterium]